MTQYHRIVTRAFRIVAGLFMLAALVLVFYGMAVENDTLMIHGAGAAIVAVVLTISAGVSESKNA